MKGYRVNDDVDDAFHINLNQQWDCGNDKIHIQNQYEENITENIKENLLH